MTMSVTLERAERHVATALSESRLCPAGLVGTIPNHHIVFPGWTVHASRALARMRTSRSIQGHEEGDAGLRRFREEPEEGRGDRTRGEEKPQSLRARNVSTCSQSAAPSASGNPGHASALDLCIPYPVVLAGNKGKRQVITALGGMSATPKECISNVESPGAWGGRTGLRTREDVAECGGTGLSVSHADLSSCPDLTAALEPGWVQQPPSRGPSA